MSQQGEAPFPALSRGEATIYTRMKIGAIGKSEVV